jgi:putative PD-(D/E)XK family protein DUF4420
VNELQELFETLVKPARTGGDTRFAVARIADDVYHLVGKDQAGFPAILIDASRDGDTALLRVELQHLTIHPDIRCEVVFPDGTHASGNYTLMRCTGDEDLQALFLRLVNSLLHQVHPATERTGLAQLIFKLVDLFRALSAPPRKSVQGLWAELFFISRSHDPISLLQAWHSDPAEIFDFSSARQKIEVKSSAHRSRVHRLSLEQLHPPAGSVGIIVSIIAERAGGGSSIEDLTDRIADACISRPELQVKLWTIVTETLGTDWRVAGLTRFDTAEASAACRLYSCDQVPRIDLNHIPSGVSHVRFDVAFSDLAPIDDARLATLGGLIDQARPRSR